MSDDLPFTFQTILVATEYLDVVIQESEESQPYGRDDHENQVDIPDTPEQEHGYQYADNDDDATHGGNTLLLHAKGIDARVAFSLKDLSPFHPFDELFTEPC